MDDVCAIVGWTRSVAMQQWFAGSNLYIPDEPDENHVLMVVLGVSVLQKLIDEFGGTTIWIPGTPGGKHAGADALKREVRRMVLAGKGSRQIAEETGISQRQAQRIRIELETVGVLPKILGKNPLKNRP